MRLLLPLCAGLLAIGAGCSPLHEVHYEEADRWLPAARQRLLGKEAVVTTRAGKPYVGTIVALDTAGVKIRSEEAETTWQLRFAEVESIQRSKKAWGVVAGILGGGLVGGIVSGAIAIGGIAGGGTMAIATAADWYQITPPPPPEKALMSTQKSRAEKVLK